MENGVDRINQLLINGSVENVRLFMILPPVILIQALLPALLLKPFLMIGAVQSVESQKQALYLIAPLN